MLELLTVGKLPTSGGALPGPPDMKANFIRPDGTGNNGYYGTFVDKGWLDYKTLRGLVGLTDTNSKGVAAYDTESSWMKFNLDGKILYVSKKMAGYGLDYTYVKNTKLDTGTVVTIGENRFKVRLLQGTIKMITSTTDVAGTKGCEYNRLLYNVLNASTIEEGSRWESFSVNDLGSNASLTGHVNNEMCTGRLFLAGQNWDIVRVSIQNSLNGYNGGVIGGWRPCLEVVND